MAQEVAILGHLVRVFGEHPDDERIVRFGGCEGEFQGGQHAARRVAMAFCPVDLEQQALARGLADPLEHLLAIVVIEQFAAAGLMDRD